jgi:uncharacterized protein
MIKFSISRVEKEPILLEGSEPAEFWALPEGDQFQPDGEVEYSLTVKAVSGSILVNGEISGKVTARCGRCLAPVELEIVNDTVELYYPKEEITEEEFDITADIRDELLIELPMNPLCDEGCEGLCPVCGVNRNEKECSCTVQGNLAWSALDNIVTEEK